MKRCSIAALLVYSIAATSANAATEVSIASGNIGTSSTWALVEPNSFTNSNTSTLALTTSFGPSSPTTFTVSATTAVAGIGVKLASNAAGSGTMTCRIETGGTQVTNAVTGAIPVTSLQSASNATNDDGGWVFMAFTSTASLATSTNYGIQCETSVASQITLQAASSTQVSVALYTSTNQAPAAGDKFFVNGIWSFSSPALASKIVTINTTSLTNYGAAANTLVSPSISISNGGTFCIGASGTCGPAASTAYVFEHAGPLVTYAGGLMELGTSSSDVPSTSSLTYTLNSTTEGDTGVNVRNGGTFDVAGDSGGRSVVDTKLTVQATGGTTSTLTTADSTGWQSGDSIYIAGTAPTSNSVASYKGETATLSGNASGTSVPLNTAVTNTHIGRTVAFTGAQTGIAYSQTQEADVALLSHNVIIQGSGSTTNGYLSFQANSNAAMTQIEFSEISGTSAAQSGITTDTGPAGTFSLTDFSIINSPDLTMTLAPTNATFGGTSSARVIVENGVFYNDASSCNDSPNAWGLNVVTATLNPYWTLEHLLFILNANCSGSGAFGLASVTGQISDIRFTGSAAQGNILPVMVFNLGYSAANQIGGEVGNIFGPFEFYANVGNPGWAGQAPSGLVSGLSEWNEQGRFFWTNGVQPDITIDPFYAFDVVVPIYVMSAGSTFTIRNGFIGFDTSPGGAAIVLDATTGIKLYADNMEFCPDTTLGGIAFTGCGPSGSPGISIINDLDPTGGYSGTTTQVYLRNSSLLNNGYSYPSLNGQEGFFLPKASIVQDCAACSMTAHAAWVQGGFLSYDTSIPGFGGYSERMTPRVTTFSGYISGTTLLATTDAPRNNVSSPLTSNGVGFIPGTMVTGSSNGNSPYTVTFSQTVGSSGSPVQFQSYVNNGSLIRLQSAPFGYGLKVAVKSGNTAQVCVNVRESLNTDSAPPWGSAATYNGDAPRLIVRQNPYMGVASDTVLATFSGSAGSVVQLCGNTSTIGNAPADGEYEFVVDADETFTSNAGGWINVGDWSVSGGAINPNGGQEFWFNGAPFETQVPSSGGGGGTSAQYIGDGLHN